MFHKFLNWIRSVVNWLIPKKTVESAIKTQVAVSSRMADAIDLWCKVYQDKAPWTHDETVKSMGLLPAISGEVARLVTLEFASEITGSGRADYLEKQYIPVKKKLRQYTEYAVGKGGLVFKPYISGGDILVDMVQAESFFPTGYSSNGKISGAVFLEQKTKGDAVFTRLETHSLLEDGVHISNRAYKSTNGIDLGREIPLSQVPEWESLVPDAMLKGAKGPLFAYFKMPFGNITEPGSPLGVSIAARAMKQIEEADRQYSRLLWEFEGGELAIDADGTFVKVDPDHPTRFTLPKTVKRLFRSMNTSDDFYQVFNPAFRDVSLLNGLNQLLRRIEFSCGLSYGILSDPNDKELTATEIVSSKQRLYTTVSEIQGALQDALDDLIGAMDYWANFIPGIPEGKYTVEYQWDDSIVTDLNTEKQLFLQEIRDGIRQRWEYRVRFFGEDEKKAKQMAGEDQTDNMLMGFGEE